MTVLALRATGAASVSESSAPTDERARPAAGESSAPPGCGWWRREVLGGAGATCTHDRASMLGEVRDGEMHPSGAEIAIDLAWTALPDRFPGVGLDACMVMPDHLHGIVMLGHDPDLPSPCTIPNLAAVLRTFKPVSGIAGNRLLGRSGRPFWQRSYFDRIIRNERELTLIRQYIDDNAARWMETEELDGS